MPKSSWTEFQKQNRGRGLTSTQLSSMYRTQGAHGAGPLSSIPLIGPLLGMFGLGRGQPRRCPAGSRKTCVPRGGALMGGARGQPRRCPRGTRKTCVPRGTCDY